MKDDGIGLTLFAIFAVVLAIGVGVWLYQKDKLNKMSWVAIFTAILPNLLLMFLMVSLAFHMRMALGQWPDSIGMENFPRWLIIHADVVIGFFIVILFGTLFVLPPVAIIGYIIVPFRRILPWLAVYYIGHIVMWLVLVAMPEGFLYWLRD